MDILPINIQKRGAERWDPDLLDFYPFLNPNSTDPSGRYHFDDPETQLSNSDSRWGTTKPWTSSELQSTSSNSRSSCISSSRVTTSASPCFSLTETNWNPLIEEEGHIELSNSVLAGEDLNTLEDWAWMDSRSLLHSINTMPLENLECSQTADHLDNDADKKSVLLASSSSRTKRTCRKKFRQEHNAVEKKYREGINSKFAKIYEWLLQQQVLEETLPGDLSASI